MLIKKIIILGFVCAASLAHAGTYCKINGTSQGQHCLEIHTPFISVPGFLYITESKNGKTIGTQKFIVLKRTHRAKDKEKIELISVDNDRFVPKYIFENDSTLVDQELKNTKFIFDPESMSTGHGGVEVAPCEKEPETC